MASQLGELPLLDSHDPVAAVPARNREVQCIRAKMLGVADIAPLVGPLVPSLNLVTPVDAQCSQET